MRSCGQGVLERHADEAIFGIGQARFFAPLNAYYQDLEHFSLAYGKEKPEAATGRVERAVKFPA